MPEPNEAVQGAQDEVNATTPQNPADQPTTVETSEGTPSTLQGVMDYLDIPPELQAKLAPTAAQPKPKEEPEEVPIPDKKDEEPEELEPDEEEEAEAEAPAAAEQPQRVDKKLKRINRLTRQKNDLERQVDHIIAENFKLRQELEKKQPAVSETAVAPLVGENLTSLQRELAKCEATLEWCDNNAEGGEIGEGENARYVDAKEIRAWRRDAEIKRQKFVVDHGKELDRLAVVRTNADQQALSYWPDMFDKTKPDYQIAVAYVRQYPFLVNIPEANLALGLLVEGEKSLRARASKNGKEPQKQHRDLDERVFSTPRVPIAPHTPEPPTRESKPSPQKQENEAMSRLVKDPDGSSEHLADVFAAMEKSRQARPTSRSPVRT